MMSNECVLIYATKRNEIKSYYNCGFTISTIRAFYRNCYKVLDDTKDNLISFIIM